VTDLAELLRSHTGRYLEKHWDWHAFPANEGYAELERAQMRYIGSGGSPKADPGTLPPGAFSCSLIHQEPGKKASVHHHEIEELFFVHRGELTMTWQFGDETVDFVCGPGDAVLNPPGRPHGFRNDGPDDCLMQIMVATAGPMLPTYTDHPKQHPVSPLHPAAAHARAGYVALIEPQVARAARTQRITRDVPGGTFSVRPYVMRPEHGGLVVAPHFTFALAELTRDAATPTYHVGAEEAFMVIDGVLDVELIDGDASAAQRLGPRDLAVVPAGVERRLLNRDASVVRFASIVGDPQADPIGWHDTSAAARSGQTQAR
jgi:mannose-6-phosphate isomerase-like protein (cupin superfamily)